MLDTRAVPAPTRLAGLNQAVGVAVGIPDAGDLRSVTDVARGFVFLGPGRQELVIAALNVLDLAAAD